MDGPSNPSGCAVHPDSTLKDASEIEWHNNKGHDSLIAPAMPHPFFTHPALTLAASHHSACTIRPSTHVLDPDNVMNNGSLSMSGSAATTVKRKVVPQSVPLCRVSQKVLVDSQTDANESEAPAFAPRTVDPSTSTTPAITPATTLPPPSTSASVAGDEDGDSDINEGKFSVQDLFTYLTILSF
jgi:hypothetical protein